MKNAIIVKCKEINLVILSPTILPEQIFRISSSIISYQKDSFRMIDEEEIRGIIKEIGISDLEIAEIVAEIN